MKSKTVVVLVALTGVALALTFTRAQRHRAADEANSTSGEGEVVQKIPPLPAGVTELKFSEFFVTPVGPLGLTLTEKLNSLNGGRVRILGYMVHSDSLLPGQFLFAAMPVQLHDHDSSDDLPPALVHVSVPAYHDREVPYAPGLMLLTGRLSVGHQEETNGRISLVRLTLDPAATKSTKTQAPETVAPPTVHRGHSLSSMQSSTQLHQH